MAKTTFLMLFFKDSPLTFIFTITTQTETVYDVNKNQSL